MSGSAGRCYLCFYNTEDAAHYTRRYESTHISADKCLAQSAKEKTGLQVCELRKSSKAADGSDAE